MEELTETASFWVSAEQFLSVLQKKSSHKKEELRGVIDQELHSHLLLNLALVVEPQ